jgi:hypothetical protein
MKAESKWRPSARALNRWAPAVLVLLVCGCRPGQVSRYRLNQLVQRDSKLCQAQEINGIRVQMRYVPYQLMVAQELGTVVSAGDTAIMGRLERKYSPQYYFRLTFSKNKNEVIRQLGSFHQYSDMLQVLSFELGNHISASTETNDTLYLKGYAYQQDYGMTKENASLLIFAKEDFGKRKEIRIRLGEFGLGIGELTFVFSKDEMDDLPALDYRQLN